MNHKK